MAFCPQHPDQSASGACEYCGRPGCAACLRSLLGRQYCQDCHVLVQRFATAGAGAPGRLTITPQGAEGAGPLAPQVTPDPADVRAAMPGWLSALLYFIGFALVLVVSQVVFALPLIWAKSVASRAAVQTADFNPLSAAGLGIPLWSTLFGLMTWGSFLAVLAFTTAMARGVERRSLAQMGLPWRRHGGSGPWRDMMFGLLIAAVFFVSVVGTGVVLDLYRVRSVTLGVDALLIAWVGFLILLPAAATEEISMRGYLLQSAARSWGTAGGVALSTLVFTLLHSLNPGFERAPLAVLGLSLAGLYLASAYLITGNLWLAIFLHTGWNLMEGPIFGLPVSGMEVPAAVMRTTAIGPPLWTGGAFGPEAGLLVCLLLVIHIAALWALRPILRRGDGTALLGEPRSYRAIPLPNP